MKKDLDHYLNNESIITLFPIGWVANDFDEPTPMDILRQADSEIILKPEYRDGLKGIQVGDHIMVLFHFHLSAEDCDLIQHPRRDKNRKPRGVFSMCSPRRPNRIGTTVVEIIEMNENHLRVRGLDAINHTPVIDIKPANRVRSP